MKKTGRTLALFSLIFVVGPFWWKTDVGGQSFAPPEAWSHWVAQPTIVSGLVLLALGLCLSAGAKWAGWGILFWCPASILGTIVWDALLGLAKPSWPEVFVEGLPVMLFWVWGVHRYLFPQIEASRVTQTRG